MRTSQLPRWLMVHMQGWAFIPDKKKTGAPWAMSPWWHRESAEIGRGGVGVRLNCTLAFMLSSIPSHSLRYHPGSHWSTMIEAKNGQETSQCFKCSMCMSLYSKCPPWYRVAELWLCSKRITMYPRWRQASDWVEGISTCNKERRGRRTRLKHRHQQFALSSLTGSGVEADTERYCFG